MFPTNEHISIRLGYPDDATALGELAQLDGTTAPVGPVLVAEQDGKLRAALSLDDGRVISDPFFPTAGLVVLLEVHAAQLRDAGLVASRRRSALRAATGVWRGLANRHSEKPAPTPAPKVAEPAVSLVTGALLRGAH